MLLTAVHAALALAVGFAYGATLKVSDLLQEHGYRFRHYARGDIAAGVLAALLGVALLALCSPDARVFWLAVILSWVLRGRIDGVNHGVMALFMLAFVLWTAPSGWAHKPSFWAFLAVLCVLGLVHDLLQYSSVRAPKPLRWFFEQQHLYWYLLVVAYLLLRSPDWIFAAGVYGFVKGYGFFYPETRRQRLGVVGIRPHAP